MPPTPDYVRKYRRPTFADYPPPKLSAIYLIIARPPRPFPPRAVPRSGKRHGICILFTHPTAILDSLLYLSEEAFIHSQLPERFALLPRASCSAKYAVLRTLHLPPWTFRYAPRAPIRPDGENIRPEFAGDNKRKGADGGRWRRAKVTLL